jgi:hypothetical protein
MEIKIDTEHGESDRSTDVDDFADWLRRIRSPSSFTVQVKFTEQETVRIGYVCDQIEKHAGDVIAEIVEDALRQRFSFLE